MSRAARLVDEGERLATDLQAQLFDLQQAVFDDSRRFRAVTCGRRSGKTVVSAVGLIEALLMTGEDEWVAYMSRTRQTSKNLMWGKLKGLISALRLVHLRPHATDLQVHNDMTGGTLWLTGADKADDIEKLRGLKLRRFIADEPATYPRTLEACMRDSVEPALGDLRGDAWIVGTPGPLCSGYWWEVSTGKRRKWSRHAWNIRQNPFFRDPDQYLRETLEENDWTEDNITYRREHLGLWVRDEGAQVYRYAPERNDVDSVPGYDRETWTHVMGVDFGMSDESAWAVLASHPHGKQTYVLRTHKQVGLLPEEAAHITEEWCQRYQPEVLVGDAGGLGKPYVEALNRRALTPIRMVAADKADKRGHIDLLNGDLRTPKLFVVAGDCQELIDEWESLPWHDDRTKEDPRFANHASDAVLYAWRHHRAYLAERPPPRRTRPLQPDDPEWIDREEREAREPQEWWDR